MASERGNLEVIKNIVKFKPHPKVVSQKCHGGGPRIILRSCILELLWDPFKQLDTELAFIYSFFKILWVSF